jgi:hypothetical protein
VSAETSAEMEAVPNERRGRQRKAGRPTALSRAEQLLMTLEFWREWRTFAHLSDDCGVRRKVEHVEAALIGDAREARASGSTARLKHRHGQCW